MKRTAIVLCLLIVINYSWAQTNTAKISGRVVTADGRPLNTAIINLLNATDSTVVKLAVSDEAGEYGIDKLRPGSYLVKASAMGYGTSFSAKIEVAESEAATIVPLLTLQSMPKNLGTVQVTALRPLIENKIDKTIVNVDAAVTNVGSTALEVLEKSPGISVDRDGNISLKGKQGVIILMDGKPTYLGGADLANLLRNMPAGQLDQIEIMSQPSAKYDASGNSGVINIKTKRQETKGFNGSVSATYTQGVYPKATSSFQLNSRKGKLNLFMNYSLSYFKGYNELNILRKFRDVNTKELQFVMDQKSRGMFSGMPHNLKVGADFFATKKTTVGVVLSGFYNERKGHTNSLTSISDGGGNIQSYNKATVDNKDPWKNFSVNLNLRHAFDKKGRELTADIDHVYYQTRTQQYSDNDSLDMFGMSHGNRYLLDGDLPSEIKIYTARVDYTHPLKGEARFEAGLKSSLVNTDNDAQFTHFDRVTDGWVNDARSNHFIYDENINAAYVNLSKQYKKFGVQVGLRMENTIAKGRQLRNTKNFDRNYTQLFPTSYLSYKLNDKNVFGLSYGRRIQRPNYQDMNPFQFLLDRYTFMQGNPDLTPQFSHNIEMSYNYKGQLNVSLNFTETSDIINDILKQDDVTKTTFQTKENIAKRRNIGIAVSYNKPLTKFWTVSLFSNTFNNYYEGIVNNRLLEAELTTFMINMNNQFKFKNGWSAELSGWFRTQSLETGLILADPMGMFGFGVSKQIWKNKGTVRVNVRDPFFLQKFSGSTRFDNIDARISNKWDNRQVSLGFTYRFGKNQNNVPQPRRKTSASQDEQNRVGGNAQ